MRLIDHKDYPFFQEYEGKPYLRDGVERNWRNDDLQSFTPLRFMPPELMDYQGRAVVVDPDVFAVGDIFELLTRDMAGKAIMCRTRAGAKRISDGNYASSVMLLDCAKLRHWQVEKQFRELFTFERDYRKWINLQYEEPEHHRAARAGVERLRPADRADQDGAQHPAQDPAVEERAAGRLHPGRDQPAVPADRLADARRRKLFGDYGLLGSYISHPDRNQEHLFFGLLRECVEQGTRDPGDAARGDAPEPRASRRLRGAGAHAATRRLNACVCHGTRLMSCRADRGLDDPSFPRARPRAIRGTSRRERGHERCAMAAPLVRAACQGDQLAMCGPKRTELARKAEAAAARDGFSVDAALREEGHASLAGYIQSVLRRRADSKAKRTAMRTPGPRRA